MRKRRLWKRAAVEAVAELDARVTALESLWDSTVNGRLRDEITRAVERGVRKERNEVRRDK